MKLKTTDGMELMEVSGFAREDGNLVVEGTIMGAMPIRAVLTPEELRGALGMLDMKTIAFSLGMLFRKSKPQA
ncbi:hypothetical protein [Acidocella sp. KAb 2-4]|uniref:hypothetical protein n=1 Tax=Acidocella sp. KAb 2-4 TaxID=2885158 RepID=UPI001D07F9E4|nr:hypothetical protein [Acidocella sp. KAb 2-4]MCB5945630.1 hypothetical protein [Acidocella sp. KAb 2-4]